MNIGPLIIAATLAGSAVKANSETVETIRQKYVQALGGKAVLERFSSRIVRSKLEIPAYGIRCDVVTEERAPNRYRTETTVPGLGKVIEGFDGKTSWRQEPGNGVVAKTDAERLIDLRHHAFNRPLEWDQLYSQLSVEGEGTLHGKATVVVIARTTAGDVDRMHFDRKTGLLVREEVNVESNGGSAFQAVIDMGDYRRVNGRLVPHSLSISPLVQGAPFKVTVEDVQFDVKLDASRFAKP